MESLEGVESLTESYTTQASEEESLRASEDDHHWVEQLFPPVFRLTVEEILKDVGKVKDTELSVFEKYARGVHPQDVTAIKNVYERVWLMAAIEREEREKREKRQQETDGTLLDSKLQKKTITTVSVQDAQTSTDDLVKYDLHDPCIWSDSEIGVLREVFQTAQKQNRDLQANLSEVNERLAKMEAQYLQQKVDLEAKTKNLSEALKANKRLNIMCHNLNKQLKATTSKNAAMAEEIEELQKDRTTYIQEAHKVKVRLDRERLERKNVEVTLERQSSDAVRETIAKEEKVRTACERTLNAMERKMEGLQRELEEEKKSHDRCKKGLEHLRRHFASLPFSGESASMVTEDQITKWTV